MLFTPSVTHEVYQMQLDELLSDEVKDLTEKEL